ncbi:MAG: hypothetical protein K8J08_09780, partial [Thermoanaerobaculia bacterium]|nr:hypothetical protein [Thermoanaerobaculia bacterium]
MKRKIDAISSGMAIAIAFWPGAGAGDLVRPRGGEFSVNTETEGEAYEAAVALDVAGNALFAWSASSSSGRRIEARFMDAEGVFQGPPSRISDPTPPPAVNLPRITPLAESRFLVVWDSFPAVPNPGFGARAQLVEGPHTSNAPDFGLSASSLESYTPDSCVLSSGKLLVSWSGFPSDVYRTAPWLRMFDANGGALTGDVRLDSPEREDEAEELLARVACGGNERAVVVWLAQNPDDPLEIFVEGRLVGPGLEFLSPVFRVSDLPLAEYFPADVVMAPDGSFTVIYMGLLDGALDILGRRFTAEGNRQGEVFPVNEYRPGGEFLGQADSDSSGNFAVVWEQATDPSGRLSEVYARVFLADGTPYGPSFHVNPDPIDDSFTDSAPSVSFADGGQLAFAWQSWLADGDDFGVRGARFELGCTTDEMTLCLSGGRFEVQAKFRGGNGLEGAGTAIQLGD